MEGTSILITVLVLLTAALLLGTLAEQLRQSAIVGYILAGVIVGPNVLGLVRSPEKVELIAQLGVALLLFTIGLEFSFRRLRRMGRVALLGGTLQIVITGLLVALFAMMFGLNLTTAIALGGMIALSSTASVLRLLAEKAALESPYGRDAMGILLLQDLAVLPLTLLVFAMSAGDGVGQVAWTLLRTILFGAMMVVAFLLLFNYVVPRLLNLRRWTANRELPILLAIVLAIGSATAARQADISPAIGAFLAGVLLAESPFAVQIRADVASLKTVLVTLFFASVGMLADPMWVVEHWWLVGAVVVAVLVGKTVIVALVLRPMGVGTGMAVATGLCLAQVGEFAFVLAESGRGIISDHIMELIVSVAVIALFLTPYLVNLAPWAAGWVEARRNPQRPAAAPALEAVTSALEPEARTPHPSQEPAPPPGLHGRILIVGFGPAGQRVAEALMGRYRDHLLVIDLNPRSAAVAQRYGLAMHVGNAAQAEVLERAGVHAAAVVVVTVPDPSAARQVVLLCKHMNTAAQVVVRSRYHAYRWELQMAGADVVVDEEEYVGMRLAAEVRRALHGAEQV
jgi:monovalent cation:H+ antiporter-2, CPA2 family